MTVTRRLHVAFAGLGATAAVFPAALPGYADALGDQALAAPPALFIGLFLAVASRSLLWRSARSVVVVRMGLLLQTVGLIVAATADLAAAFVAGAFLAGVGFGLCEIAGSQLARELARDGSREGVTGGTARLLTSLTTTVAIVAVVWPLLVLLASTLGSPGRAAFATTAALTTCGALWQVPGRTPRVEDSPNGRSRWRRPRGVVGIAVALVCYVGVESVLAGWSAVIPSQLLGVPAAWAALGTSAFWLLIAAGRAGSTLLMRRGVRTGRIIAASSATGAAMLGVSAVLVEPAPGFAQAGIALSVFAIAPLYGLLLARGLASVPSSDASVAAGVLVGSGAAGGALIPASVALPVGAPSQPGVLLIMAVLCVAVALLARGLGTSKG